MTDEIAVALAGVHRNFGSVRAVDGIDLDLKLGEIAALLGPNGAGKTTSIDIILGLGKPDRGTVRVLDMKPSAAISRGLVAAVMQTGSYLWLVIFGLLCATVSVYYYFRVIQAMYFKEGVAQEMDLGRGFQGMLILLAGIVILLGIFPQLLIERLYIIYL